jgi:hypothetical protein
MLQDLEITIDRMSKEALKKGLFITPTSFRSVQFWDLTILDGDLQKQKKQGHLRPCIRFLKINL